MRVVGRRIAWLVPLVFGCQLSWAADPEIAYREVVHHNSTVTVMEANGSNPTRIFPGNTRGYKNLNSTCPSWSPTGDWIALIARDKDLGNLALYKVRVDGRDLTKVLCSVGTGLGGFEFGSPFNPQWSPKGDWILVQGENWLGVIGAHEEPDTDCHSNLYLLYDVGWDGLDGEGWWMAGSPAWNHDGSRIAVFEFYEVNESPVDWRLQILEVESVDGEPTVTSENPWPLEDDLQQVMPIYGTHPDWQRQSGKLIAFTTSDGGSDPEFDQVSWFDTTTGLWGHLIDGANASWAPDNSRIVFNQGAELIVADLTFDDDEFPIAATPHTVGEGWWPDWKRGSSEPTCSIDSDCGTGYSCCSGACIEPKCVSDPLCEEIPANVCTTDSCDPCTGCNHVFAPENDPSCETTPVDCGATYSDPDSCNEDPECRWHKKKGCVNR